VQLIVTVKLMEDIPLCYGSIERIIAFQSNTNYILNQIRRLHVLGYVNNSPSGLVYKIMIDHCISCCLSCITGLLMDHFINPLHVAYVSG